MAQQMSPQQANAMARLLVQSQSVQMIQQIFSQSFTPSSSPVVNVIPRNVGLIKGFWVKVVATISNTGETTAITPTDFGPANTFSNISFTDLNNNIRVNAPGWYVNLVNSLKARRPYGAAFLDASDDYPVKYGSNFTPGVPAATASIAAGDTGTITFWYWVPLAYSDSDYRGAVYGNVVNATMQLSLTFNPNPVVSSGDTTAAIYTGNTGAMTAATVTVYQVYQDQLPMGPNGPVLPMLDLSTIYELKTTVFTSLVAGQDFPMQYSNFRDFLSTVAVYFNGTARGTGSDVNYFALQSANFTNIWKMEPGLLALRTRLHLGYDLPKGTYYFGSREKPIATTQYGNMELILNPITAGASAYVLVGYEDFALVNSLTMAGSLSAG